VWDFWFAQNGADIHIFYLQAPNDLAHESMRHWHTSVGHAVSQDLINWTVLQDALSPSPADSNAWDNYTTWTGSIIKHDGLWYMFYTGSTRAEKGLIQRVGLATSPDLLTWTKHERSPVLTADPRWYEQLDAGLWHDQAWRDPWVFHHNGRFHAFITARGLGGEPSGRGVIAHAVSDNLIDWECLPPVAHPAEFGQLEVPQLVQIGDRWYLFFCVGHKEYARVRKARPGTAAVTGTHYLVGDNPLGPFAMIDDQFLLADEVGSHYAGKVIRDPAGSWVLMTSRSWTGDGGFVGEIADPIPLTVLEDGRLQAALPQFE
jgi:beta-fructofuranosidase